MSSLIRLNIIDFLEKTASGNPVPGGGSIAALSAAVAASLSEMVANLTIGKSGFEHVETEMKSVAANARNYRQKLLKDIDRDADAFNAVMDAFRLPKNTEAERGNRRQALQAAFKTASLVPLNVAKAAYEVMALAEKTIREGNKNAVTDAAVAVMMARTAVLSALYNVKINLGSISEPEFVKTITEQIEALEAAAEMKEKELRSLVQ